MRAGIPVWAALVCLFVAAPNAVADQDLQALDGILLPEDASDDAQAAQPARVSYEFDECERPVEPVLATDPTSQGRITVAARNRAVRQYNAHVEASNAYMRCLAEEAERDLKAYYMAVSAALDAEQADVMTDLEALREDLR